MRDCYPEERPQLGSYKVQSRMGDSDLTLLRRFRDHYLLRSAAGRQMVRFYYEISPWLIDRYRNNSSARPLLTVVYKLQVWSAKRLDDATGFSGREPPAEVREVLAAIKAEIARERRRGHWPGPEDGDQSPRPWPAALCAEFGVRAAGSARQRPKFLAA